MHPKTKFRSFNGEKHQIQTTLGHSAIIGEDWRTLPESLHGEALKTPGIECDKQTVRVDNSPKPKAGTKAMKQVADTDTQYRDVLKKMLTRNKKGDFTASDQPNLMVVAQLVGFSPVKADVYRVYADMKAELLKDGDEGGDGDADA